MLSGDNGIERTFLGLNILFQSREMIHLPYTECLSISPLAFLRREIAWLVGVASKGATCNASLPFRHLILVMT